MDDGAALLAAIVAHPDEDTPRLVYADWLEEQGEGKRAEFIRRQIENANRNDGRSYARFRPPGITHSLESLAAIEPWKHVSGDHVSPLVLFAGGGRGINYALCVGWYRGFPAVVGCTARKWHTNFARFVVPLELLCLESRSHEGVWRAQGDAAAGFVYRSSINSAVPIMRAEQLTTTTYLHSLTLEAFPNVRRVAGTCSAAWLHAVCARQLRPPEPGR